MNCKKCGKETNKKVYGNCLECHEVHVKKPEHITNKFTDICNLIAAERKKQDEEFGELNSQSTLQDLVNVLAEEAGEASKCFNEKKIRDFKIKKEECLSKDFEKGLYQESEKQFMKELKEELIQVAATAVQIIERLGTGISTNDIKKAAEMIQDCTESLGKEDGSLVKLATAPEIKDIIVSFDSPKGEGEITESFYCPEGLPKVKSHPGFRIFVNKKFQGMVGPHEIEKALKSINATNIEYVK